MTEDHHPPDMVEFHRAKTPFDARIVVAVLHEAGIPAFVPGGLLTDEFAMSQRLLNANAVQVFVPADRLEDARVALEASRGTDDAELEAQALAADPESADEDDVLEDDVPEDDARSETS